jgi:hypothetical protein
MIWPFGKSRRGAGAPAPVPTIAPALSWPEPTPQPALDDRDLARQRAAELESEAEIDDVIDDTIGSKSVPAVPIKMAAERQTDSQSTPRHEVTLLRRPPEDHAAALLKWLRDSAWSQAEAARQGLVCEDMSALGVYARKVAPDGSRIAVILFTDIHEIYTEMCMELGWQQLGWNPVGRCLHRSLGVGKRYVYTVDDDGNRSRVRAYDINIGPPAAAASPAAEDRLAA